MLKTRIFCLLACFFLISVSDLSADSLTPEQDIYLQELIDRANRKQLSQNRYWHILLHYHKALGGVVSEADADSFFLSRQGKTDPQAELEATLRSFFATGLFSDEVQHPQCRFIARYTFLNNQLNFDQRLLAPQACSLFRNWSDAIPRKTLTLVFASYDQELPASMFGHTLLLFKNDTGSPLMDFAVNYAANADPDRDNAIVYALYGLFGGYQGHFSLKRYYIKIKEYTDIDVRDIWEYELDLTPEEIDRMVMHLWELRNTYFDYFFFKENCSYHLLALLESARPELMFQDKHLLWATPPETVRQVAETPGLVSRLIYRPSRMNRLRQRILEMSEQEKALFKKAVSDEYMDIQSGLQELPEKSQAAVLEALSDYYLIEKSPENLKRRQKLILKRAGLKLILPEPPQRQFSSPPESGHLTSRLGLGFGGNSDGERLTELELRPSFHDLLGVDDGFMRNSQIEFFKTLLRFNHQHKQAYLEEFALVTAVTLSPISYLRSDISWKASTGWRHPKNVVCTNCNVYTANAGIGATWSIADSYLFLMAETLWDFGPIFEADFQGGLGSSVGWLLDFKSDWKLHLNAAYYSFQAGDTGEYGHYSAHLRYQPAKNWELRFKWDQISTYSESILSLKKYF